MCRRRAAGPSGRRRRGGQVAVLVYARFDGAGSETESVSRGYVPLFAGPYPDFTDEWWAPPAGPSPGPSARGT